MENIWSNDKNAKCIHPGWPIINGWEAIKDSWKNIFESSGFNQVDISQLFIDVKENSAWVNCVERISYRFENEIIITLAQTTNIYEYSEENWKLVLHHASPMPVPRGEDNTERLQ